MTISTKRKADRMAMADRLEAIAKKHGATVERRDHVGDLLCSAREVTLRINLGPHGLNIDLDAQHDFVLGSWHGSEKLPEGFTFAARGPVNEYHGRKATSGCSLRVPANAEREFNLFCEAVDAGLACISRNLSLAPALGGGDPGLAPSLSRAG